MLPTAYHPDYYCPKASRLPSTRKQKEVYEQALASGILDRSDILDVPLAGEEEIALAHTQHYIRAVKTGEPRYLAESQGFMWSPEFVNLVFRTAGGQHVAALAALKHGIAFNLASGAHHAISRQGMGFCTFNFLVTAPRMLAQLGRLQRVLVIDFDEHQGNGTYEITRNDRRFFCYDVSGTDFGVPVHEGDDGIYIMMEDDVPATYQAAIERLPEVIERFEPDLIEYNAGMDSWERDPLCNCWGISAAFLAERDEQVLSFARAAKVPLVVCLAGGYQEHGTPRTVDLHVKTIEIARRVYNLDRANPDTTKMPGLPQS